MFKLKFYLIFFLITFISMCYIYLFVIICYMYWLYCDSLLLSFLSWSAFLNCLKYLGFDLFSFFSYLLKVEK